MPLRDWAVEVLEAVGEIATILDVDDEGYSGAADAQLAAVTEPELTPSAQILSHMREAGLTFQEFTLESARAHDQYFTSVPPSPEKQEWLRGLTAESLREQERLEANPDRPFAEYLRDYFERV